MTATWISGRAIITLPGLPSSAGIARAFVRDRLKLWSADVMDDAEAIVAELVVNAVVHVGSPVTLALRTSLGGVRIEVADQGGGPFPELLRPPLLPPARGPGRGLRIVDALATKWGVDWLPYGKRVWATLAARTP